MFPIKKCQSIHPICQDIPTCNYQISKWSLSNQCFSNFNLNTDAPGNLLKWRLWFSTSWVGGRLHFSKLLESPSPKLPRTTLWIAKLQFGLLLLYLFSFSLPFWEINFQGLVCKFAKYFKSCSFGVFVCYRFWLKIFN